MTRSDIKLLVFLCLAVVLAVPMSGMAGGDNDGTAMLYGPGGMTRVALDEPGTYVVEGRSGQVVFEVADSELRCVSSTCPDKLCVRMGCVSAGRPVVCAPNGVSAMLSSGAGDSGEEPLDAVSR